MTLVYPRARRSPSGRGRRQDLGDDSPKHGVGARLRSGHDLDGLLRPAFIDPIAVLTNRAVPGHELSTRMEGLARMAIILTPPRLDRAMLEEHLCTLLAFSHAIRRPGS